MPETHAIFGPQPSSNDAHVFMLEWENVTVEAFVCCVASPQHSVSGSGGNWGMHRWISSG